MELRIENTQPRAASVGSKENRCLFFVGMNVIDVEKWDRAKKSKSANAIRGMIERGELIEHYSKTGKITKKVVQNTWIVDELKTMREKTRSASIISLIDDQIKLITDGLETV